MSKDQVRDFREARECLDTMLADLGGRVARDELDEAEDALEQAADALKALAAKADSTVDVQCRSLRRLGEELSRLEGKVHDGLDKRESSKEHDGNVAIKLNWNDQDYGDVCTDAAYQHNLLASPGSYCPISPCRQFTGTTDLTNYPCYESVAFSQLMVGAGWDHKGGHLHRPRRFLSVRRNRYAVLTTIKPGDDERRRRIIGMLWMARITEDPGHETMIYGEPEHSFVALLDLDLCFWDYYRNPNRPDKIAWQSQLNRYLSNEATLKIMSDMRDRLADQDAVARLDGAMSDFRESIGPSV